MVNLIEPRVGLPRETRSCQRAETPPEIREALAKHNFTEPTEPQIKAIPAMLEGARTTLAFWFHGIDP